jgi:hypothetical protein
MERPYIVCFENQTETSFDVTVHCEFLWLATDWTRDYFGHNDATRDYRNRNRVEYRYSDFAGNHTYRVLLNGGLR